MSRRTHLRNRLRLLAALLLPLAAAALGAGCGQVFDDDDFGSSVTVVCVEDLTNDAQFREIVLLHPGQSTRFYDFSAFQGASYTAEIRIVDGSQSWSITARVRDGSGAPAVATGTIASPGLTFAFTAPDDDMHRIAYANAGTESIVIEVRGLRARGSQEDTAFGLNIHFAGPLTGLTPAEVSATAADLAGGIRAYYEAHGIALAGVQTYTHTTAELRALRIPVNRSGDAALSVTEVDTRRTSCGAGSVIIGGFDELGRLARPDNDNIDLVLVGSIEAGVVGVSPRGGRLHGGSSAVFAVEMIDFDGRPRATATLVRVAVHEIGHFLSLAHTADFDRASGAFEDDGLSDTPSAQSFVDRDGDGFPGLGEGCPDESLVMFPRVTGGCIFSAQQVARMRDWLSLVTHTATGAVAPTLGADLALDTIALPEAYADRAYQAGLNARGGAGPITVSITSGTLPPGLALDPIGRIHGTTSATGEFRLVVLATDDLGATAARTYLLEVRPEVLAAFYVPRTSSRPELGADVLVAPFRGDATPRDFALSATGGVGRYLFDCNIFGVDIDPLAGVISAGSSSPPGVLEITTLSVHDVNRSEDAVVIAVNDP